MSLRIQISGKRVSYDFTLRNRYTVIVGCSATGKSVLSDLLISGKRRPGYRFNFSNGAYTFVDVSTYDTMLSDEDFANSPYVVIVDDTDEELSPIVQMFMRECKGTYFVFITRNESIKHANYGLNDVYEMVTVRNQNILIPAFTYGQCFHGLKRLPENTVIVSEDSKSGLTFYRELFTNNEVIPIVDKSGNITGKDGLMSMLENMDAYGVRDTFVIADWCSFGNYAHRLSAYAASRPSNKAILLETALSLEYVLLHTNLIKFSDDNDDVVLAYPSTERCYEALLEDLTKNTPYYQKHGGVLKDCYYLPCCSMRQSSCEAKLHGKDKFVALLKGTKFEVLLKLAGRL